MDITSLIRRILNPLRKRYNKSRGKGESHMATIFDVAKYILHEKGYMSTWKLQKLCYYSQAWHYAWSEKPLFKETFQAWKNGPVCRDLFNKHRGRYIIGEDDIDGNIDVLSRDEIETITIILRDYGDMSPSELREQTHSEDPWKNARGNLPENASCDAPITLESMGEYYGSL